MNNLEHQVEALRKQMVKLAEEKQNLLDEQVIAISQELDELLLILQRQAPHRKHIVIIR